MFRYNADILPVTIVLLSFVADVVVFLVAPWWVAVPWAVVNLLPKACICAWNHHHQHVATFKHKYANRALEVVYGLQTGALPMAWELHHNAGHHVNYMDQTKDESRWKTLSGRAMGWLEYSTSVWATSYFRIWAKAKQSAASKRQQFVLWATITVLVVVLAMVWNPVNALAIFVMPMVVGLYVTAWHTYYHHAGLDTDDELQAAWNILHTGYNVLTGNLGYHPAHHVRCTVRWSELPAFHAKIQDKIPAALYRRPCFPFTVLGKAWHPDGHPRKVSEAMAAKWVGPAFVALAREHLKGEVRHALLGGGGDVQLRDVDLGFELRRYGCVVDGPGVAWVVE
ncbi:MAG: fatty acid desaturase [Myxococcota bacterium]